MLNLHRDSVAERLIDFGFGFSMAMDPSKDNAAGGKMPPKPNLEKDKSGSWGFTYENGIFVSGDGKCKLKLSNFYKVRGSPYVYGDGELIESKKLVKMVFGADFIATTEENVTLIVEVGGCNVIPHRYLFNLDGLNIFEGYKLNPSWKIGYIFDESKFLDPAKEKSLSC